MVVIMLSPLPPQKGGRDGWSKLPSPLPAQEGNFRGGGVTGGTTPFLGIEGDSTPHSALGQRTLESESL